MARNKQLTPGEMGEIMAILEAATGNYRRRCMSPTRRRISHLYEIPMEQVEQIEQQAKDAYNQTIEC